MERTCLKRVIISNEMVPEKLFQLRDYGRLWLINHQQLSPTDSHTDLGIVMSADCLGESTRTLFHIVLVITLSLARSLVLYIKGSKLSKVE